METCLMKCGHGSGILRALKPDNLKLSNTHLRFSSTAINAVRRAYDALLLDAGGTLLQLSKPVEETYASIATKYGLRLSPAEIKQGFKRAFAAPWPEKLRYRGDGRTFWKLVVSEATGCTNSDYFEEVYEYYAEGDAWHLPDGAYETILLLKDAGVKVAVVSNFDTRLRKLLKDLNVVDLASKICCKVTTRNSRNGSRRLEKKRKSCRFDSVIISSEIGYEKPDARIFKAALDQIGVEPVKAVHVGDDENADKLGANAVGIDCWLWGQDVKTFSQIQSRLLIPESKT